MTEKHDYSIGYSHRQAAAIKAHEAEVAENIADAALVGKFLDDCICCTKEDLERANRAFGRIMQRARKGEGR